MALGHGFSDSKAKTTMLLSGFRHENPTEQ